MSKTLNAKQMTNLIESLNWSGHVTLPEFDIQWLGSEIAAALGSDGRRCDNCGRVKEVLVKLTIGDICEKCLDEASEEAEEQREAQEE